MTIALRTLTIPANDKGLPEGTWIRWPELRAFLVNDHHWTAVADEIERELLGVTIYEREIKVRA